MLSSYQNIKTMRILANTIENKAMIKALETLENTVGEMFWEGNVTHDNLDKCLTGLNLLGINSGWYKPISIRIDGLSGIYLVNQNGSLFCEARIIKQDENKYLIENLTSEGWDKFEKLYSKFVDEI